MLDPYNTMKYAELRYKERLEEAERVMRYDSLPDEPLLPRLRAKLAAFANRLNQPAVEQPCPEFPSEQPAHYTETRLNHKIAGACFFSTI